MFHCGPCLGDGWKIQLSSRDNSNFFLRIFFLLFITSAQVGGCCSGSHFSYFLSLFFLVSGCLAFLSSIYSPNHRLVFYPLLIPVRGLFFFLYFWFLTLWCLFSFSFCIFVFSPCAMIVILNLLIATDFLKRHRFWAHSWRNQ